MKEYLLGLWNKFKSTSVGKKILLIVLMILYITIVCGCIIQVEVDATTPGSVTNVSHVINIDSEYESGGIYTVSVYSRSKVSYLHYLLSKLDKNSEISLGKSINYQIYTENEEYISNVGYKKQSIQDSIIVAYNAAIEDGFKVVLDYQYQGQHLINIPQNLYKTGAEDFKNGDIITHYNDITLESEENYYSILDSIFDSITFENESIKSLKDNNRFIFRDGNGERIESNIKLVRDLYEFLKTQNTTFLFKVLRNDKEKEVTASLKMLFYLYTGFVFKNDLIYTVTDNNFTSYKINYDKCSPKINIEKSTTVGPSGGLLQALAVYNSITENDITKGLRIMGTGGITIDGEATIIGSEQQKIVTANLYAADVFFIPEQNYQSAKEKYDQLEEISFDLVSVKTFRDVLNYLNNKEVNNE